jgi:Flp pilus assembly protein TadB
MDFSESASREPPSKPEDVDPTRQWPLRRAFLIMAICALAFSFVSNPVLLWYYMVIGFISVCVIIQSLRILWAPTEPVDPPADN